MISNRPESEKGQIRLLAKRTAGPMWPIGDKSRELVHDGFLTELLNFKPTLPPREDNPFAESGLFLHDPDGRPFTPDTTALLGLETQGFRFRA